MATVAGNGGFIVKGSTTMSVNGWTGTKHTVLGETTHSGTNSWETHVSTKKGLSLRAEILWDTTNHPEAMGVDAGDSATVTLNIGDSTVKYTNVPIIVESVEVTGCTQEGAVKAVINAKSNGTVPDPA